MLFSCHLVVRTTLSIWQQVSRKKYDTYSQKRVHLNDKVGGFYVLLNGQWSVFFVKLYLSLSLSLSLRERES